MLDYFCFSVAENACQHIITQWERDVKDYGIWKYTAVLNTHYTQEERNTYHVKQALLELECEQHFMRCSSDSGVSSSA